MAKCELCGEPMPDGEEMFKYHGYSGPCPKPPKPSEPKDNVTIHKSDIVARHCDHCGTKTMQLGNEGNTCLQCIADGGGCCTIKLYNRWQDETGKALVEPRGSAL